jgi:hypothetical protein
MDNHNIKILGNVINKDEYFLHPITLKLGKNKSNEPLVPTTIYYVNGEIKQVAVKNTNNLTKVDIQKFMALPYLNINIYSFLDIYHIITIDDLIDKINKMMEVNKNFQTINRLINIWIHVNYNELSNNYKILITIYNKLGKKYYPNINLSNIDKNIKEWFTNRELNDFYLNLGNYLFIK